MVSDSNRYFTFTSRSGSERNRGSIWRAFIASSTGRHGSLGFPPDLWPAEEEESEEGRIFLKLKNGTRLLAYEPDGTRRTSCNNIL